MDEVSSLVHLDLPLHWR